MRPALLTLALLAACAPDPRPQPGDPDADGDGYPASQDCDDDNPDVRPLAAEVCNGIDDDCDREIDEDSADDRRTFFADADQDGFGAAEYPREACAAPPGFVDDDTDCDDGDPDAFPGAYEFCDEVDSDCDGDLTDGDPDELDRFYPDADDDGVGATSGAVEACEAPEGMVSTTGDCDDGDPNTFPGAPETWYDGVDQDCSGGDDYDADSDGHRPASFGGGDCDDADPALRPGATEVCDDLDNNCDGEVDEGAALDAGTWYLDEDRDGYGLRDQPRRACEAPPFHAAVFGDCDDSDRTIKPGAAEIWYDGVDQDCDGASDFDADLDSYDSILWGGLDCDDADPATIEAQTWWPDPDGDGYGDAEAEPIIDCLGGTYGGYVDNGGDCDESDNSIHAGAPETAYDGVDQDCDDADRIDADRDGFPSAAYGGDDCDDADAAVHPYAWEDTGDGVDNDCDGVTDTDAEPVELLTLSDDDSTFVEPGAMSFPFCGLTRTSFYVSSNGRVTFDAGSFRVVTSPSAHAAEASIAGFSYDLDPGAGGTVAWVDHGDAIGVYFRDVPVFGRSTVRHSFSIVMIDDGTILTDWEGLSTSVGLVGWSCGTGDVDAVDISASAEGYPDGGLGVGQGTEDGLYEVFNGTSTPDVSGGVARWCVQSGDDVDNDGWSDACGDMDDDNVTIYPL
jgi:hypothetical protein